LNNRIAFWLVWQSTAPIMYMNIRGADVEALAACEWTS